MLFKFVDSIVADALSQYMYPVMFLQTYLRKQVLGDRFWLDRKAALERARANPKSLAAEIYNRNAVEAFLVKRSTDFLMNRGVLLVAYLALHCRLRKCAVIKLIITL